MAHFDSWIKAIRRRVDWHLFAYGGAKIIVLFSYKLITQEAIKGDENEQFIFSGFSNKAQPATFPGQFRLSTPFTPVGQLFSYTMPSVI
jgi:hypothetical protein